MKKISLICMLALLTPVAASADTPQAVIKNSDHACVSGIDGDVCSHAFGDSDITVSLAAGGKDCGAMKALLLQMSTRLAAPIEGAVTPVAFDGCKGQEVTVHLPKVNAPTEFRVTFSPDNSKAPEVVVPVEAYPRDLLDPLKDWAKDDRDALVVQDKDGRLKDFLDRNKIEFSTGESAKARKVTIVVADPEDMKDDKPEGNVMYLSEKVKDVPMVTVERTQQGATATVNMKLVDGLSVDDPLAEKAFVKIFNMVK